jgi:hypothetical protein
MHPTSVLPITPKDLKVYIHFNTVVVGDFHTPPSPIDR